MRSPLDKARGANGPVTNSETSKVIMQLTMKSNSALT